MLWKENENFLKNEGEKNFAIEWNIMVIMILIMMMYSEQSDEESENDPEIREPEVKRRRIQSKGENLKETVGSDGLEKGSDEDIIPFANDEYESIDMQQMKFALLW